MTNVKVFFIKNDADYPVACVASRLKDNDTVEFAVSVWNPKDTFDRHLGHEIAVARLTKGKIVGQVPRNERVKLEILKYLASGPKVVWNSDKTRESGDHLPLRVQNAARYRMNIFQEKAHLHGPH